MSLLVNLMNHGYHFRKHPAVRNGVNYLEVSRDEQNWSILPMHPTPQQVKQLGFDAHQAYLEYYQLDDEELCQFENGYSSITRDKIDEVCRKIGLLSYSKATVPSSEVGEPSGEHQSMYAGSDLYITPLDRTRYEVDIYTANKRYGETEIITLVFDHKPGPTHVDHANRLLQIAEAVVREGEIISCTHCGHVEHWAEADGRLIVQGMAISKHLCGQCLRDSDPIPYGTDSEEEDYTDTDWTDDEAPTVVRIEEFLNPVLVTTAGSIDLGETRAQICKVQEQLNAGEIEDSEEAVRILTQRLTVIVIRFAMQSISRADMVRAMTTMSLLDYMGSIVIWGHDFSIDDVVAMWNATHPDEEPIHIEMTPEKMAAAMDTNKK